MKSLARERDRLELGERLQRIGPETRGRWGRMSAPQMVCHARDALLMALGEKPVTPSTGVLQRTVLKWFALYAPLPWPAGITTSPELDQCRGGSRTEGFAADVAQVLALIDRVARERSRTHQQRHPIFGKMSASEWLRWGYLHLDHHLRQFGA